MGYPRFFLAFICVFCLVACQGGGEVTVSQIDVQKSPIDDRGYRYLTLDNQLDVLLISSPDTDKAAASLSVNAGSFQNPPDRDGLAHFLEHMLFLGTDKYPTPGEYQTFISEHGGMFNAYTSLEETNYFFDVDAGQLMPALDRFSRFFVAPLFNQDYVDREQHAVESEYRLKIKDDSRREWDVLRELANPEHPFSRFAVGNLDTLADRPGDPVREDLLAFYQAHYSANQMKLVVLGQESLNTLEAAVRQRFSAVPNHNIEVSHRDKPLFAQKTPFRVYIKPEKDTRSLTFYFPLPSVAEDWAQKPLQYLGHLIGHEGEGSLLQQLKQRGLAQGLSAGLVYDSREGALFAVNLMLTPEGFEHQKWVSAEFFQWLQLVKDQGLEEWRYQEIATMSELGFRFSEKNEVINYVSRLSSGLHEYPPQEILRGPFLYRNFDLARIREVARYLAPENAAILVSAPDVDTDKATALYQAPYRLESVSSSELSADAFNEGLVALTLSLPLVNDYIPEDVTVKTRLEGPDKPLQLVEDEHQALWFFQDNRFYTPRALFQARIYVPGLDDIKQETLLDLYLAMVEDELSSQAYPAALAGLSYNLSRWDNGLTLTIQGYTSKQSVLLNRVLQVLSNPARDDSRFLRVKETMQRNWRNTAKEWPIRQLFARLPTLVVDGKLPVDKADVLAQIDQQQLEAFAGALWPAPQVRFYAGGSMDSKQAQALAASVSQQLVAKSTSVKPVYKVRNLAPNLTLAQFQTFIDHDDAAALLYLQGRDDSLGERALIAVLQVATEAPFYTQLRTERQLGYVVGSQIVPFNRVPGLMYYVQSPVRDSVGLRQEINDFLARFGETVASTSEADLERYKSSVLTMLLEKPKNIQEQNARYLESLNLGYSGFDFRQQLAREVKALRLEDFIRGYERLCLGEREGLWLLSGAQSSAGKEALAIEPGYLEDDYIYVQ